MNAQAAYNPPTVTAIAKAQNAEANLKLLLVQRRLYSQAKRWAFFRGLGVGLVAVTAPLIAAFWAPLAEWASAFAAVWYALNRALFRYFERRKARLGAAAQEQFDLKVFGMPIIAVREPRLLPEDIALIDRSARRRKAFSEEELRNWYPIRKDVSGRVAIAIAQRGNLSYSRRLLQRYALLWLSSLCAWVFITLGIAIYSRFDLATFLLAVALPVLPPLVDALDEFLQVRAAGSEREALANEIEDAIRADVKSPITAQQLLAWQGQLFALRRDTPLVPDWLYRLFRDCAETEMSDAAETICKETT